MLVSYESLIMPQQTQLKRPTADAHGCSNSRMDVTTSCHVNYTKVAILTYPDRYLHGSTADVDEACCSCRDAPATYAEGPHKHIDCFIEKRNTTLDSRT